METRIPGRKRCALAVYRKDSSVKTKSALCVVRLAGNVVKQAISKLNALNSMGLILDQGHPRVDMTEGVPVDRIEMDVGVEDERQTL